MKRPIHTLICLTAVCLAAASAESLAQSKSRKSGGFSIRSGKSGSSNSFRSNSNRGNSSFGQSKSGSSFRTKTSSFGSGSKFGLSDSSGKGSSFSPKTTSPRGFSSGRGLTLKSGRFNNIAKPKNGITGQSFNLRGQSSKPNGFFSGKSLSLQKNTLKAINPKLGQTKFKTVPFVRKNNEQNNSSAKSGSSRAHGGHQHNWKHLVHNILHNHNHRNHWCHTRPATCHWWVGYCKPISHCHTRELVTCDWSRVRCSATLHAGFPAQEVQWYLGLKGILLPGKGMGIDTVEPGSPADRVGLQPGMVITVCNGIPLVDEAAMQEAIRISGGTLHLTLLSADGSQVLEGVAQMARVAAVRF